MLAPVTAFLPSQPVAKRRIAWKRCTCRSPPSCRRAASMSGKGFGGKPRDAGAAPLPGKPPPSPDAAAGAGDDAYVPRGPTLRQDYERRGVIEPELGPDSGVLPEVVANRMLRRILTFGGVPLTLLFAFFAAYFVLKYRFDITVLPVVVAYSTLGTIALATAGISYGIFSSSWDEDVEGTKLGWEEAKTNFVRAKDGLSGAREREIREDEFERLDNLGDDED